MGESIAFLAAILFSSQVLLIRWGLSKDGNKHKNTVEETQIAILTFGILFLFLGIIVASLFFDYSLLSELKQLNRISMILLVVEGLLGPLSGLYLVTLAIGQIGASRTSALRASNSLFAAILSAIILRENPGLLGFTGVIVITIGIALASLKSEKAGLSLLPKTKIKGVFIALLSGLFFALSQIARGTALDYGATPTTALIVDSFTAIFFLSLYYFYKERGMANIRKFMFSRGVIYFAAAGIVTIIARYAVLFSFLYIPIWLTVVIRNTQPLLVIIFSWLFLKKAENINLRLVLGTILIVCGIWILIY